MSENGNVLNFPRKGEEPLTPRLLLEEVLKDVNDIEGIVLVVQSKDGEVIPTWTSMPVERLVYLLWRLNVEVDRIIPNLCPECGYPHSE